MSDGRPGTLVCACTADGRIVLHAPYDFEDNRIGAARQEKARAASRYIRQEHDCGRQRSCATCIHQTPIGAQAPAQCAGCIVLGACTKWQEMRLPAGRTSSVTADAAPPSPKGKV